MKYIFSVLIILLIGTIHGQEIPYISGTLNKSTTPRQGSALRETLETDSGTYFVHSIRGEYVLSFFDGATIKELFKKPKPLSVIGNTREGILLQVNPSSFLTANSEIVLVNSSGIVSFLFQEDGFYRYALQEDVLYSFSSTNGVRRYDLTGEFEQLSDEYSHCNSCDKDFYFYQDRLFYETADNVWVTDGTPQGTKSILESNSSSFGELFGLNGKLYVRGTSRLNAYDIENDLSVNLLRDLPNTEGNLRIRSEAVPSGNRVLFIANSDDFGWEVFTTDGTKAGTVLVADVITGPDDGITESGVGFEGVGGSIIFRKTPEEGDSEFWISDGTIEGTFKIFDLDDEAVLFRGSMVGFQRSDGKIILAVYPETTNEANSYIYSIDPANAGQEAVLVATVPFTLDNQFPSMRMVGDRFVTTVGNSLNRHLLSYGTEVNDIDTLDHLPESYAYLLSTDSILAYFKKENGVNLIRFSDGKSSPFDSTNTLTSVIPTGFSKYEAVFKIGDLLFAHMFSRVYGECIFNISQEDFTSEFVTDIFDFTLGSSFVNIESIGDQAFVLPSSGPEFLVQKDAFLNLSEPEGVYSPPGLSNFVGRIGDRFYYSPTGGGNFLTEINITEATINTMRMVPANINGSIGKPVLLKDKIYVFSDHNGSSRINTLLEITPLTRQVDTLYRETTGMFANYQNIEIASDGELLYLVRLENEETKLSSYNPTTGEFSSITDHRPFTTFTFRKIGSKILVESDDDLTNEAKTRWVSGEGLGQELPLQFTNREDVLYDLGLNLLAYNNVKGLRSIDKESGEETLIASDNERIDNIITINNREALFFQRPNSTSPWTIKITDGTIAGTRTVQNVPDAIKNGIIDIEKFGAHLAMIGDEETGLFLFDPAREVFQLTEFKETTYFRQLDMVGINELLYFMAEDSVDGFELHHLEVAEQNAINGYVFSDINENGIRDEGEPGLNNVNVEVSGDHNYTLFTTGEGKFSFPAQEGNEYIVNANPQNCIDLLTTPTETYSFIFSEEENDELAFGYRTTQGAPSIRTLLNSGTIRCGFDINFWFTIINDGCLPMAGRAVLTLGEEVSFLGSSEVPETIDDQTISFKFDTLSPAASHQILLSLRMPDEDFVGLPVQMQSFATGLNGEVSITSDTFHYAEELRCAIDPNDKQVAPSRPDSTNSNFTQLDETIRYTIRFQNTGNDTAFTVRVEDVLTPELDLETFRPLTASHPYTVSIEDRRVVFLFKDILLPDSTINLPLSQGFVTFEIKTLPDLEDFTTVENDVGIFFDFNQPVITNTVSSSIVEFLDEDEDGFLFFEECDDKNRNIFPGAAEIAGNGIDENCDGDDNPLSVISHLQGTLNVFPNPTSGKVHLQYSETGALWVTVLNAYGSKLTSEKVNQSGTLDLGRFASGIYLLKVHHLRTGQVSTYKVVRK